MGALRFFRLASGSLGGVPVVISRTGYTGDLGYEIWTEAEHALRVWDTLVASGRPHGLTPCGLIAMDMARIEAGFVLLDVDYIGSERALIPSQFSSPYELGLGWAVHLEKESFVGRQALADERRERGRREAWRLVGLEIPWGTLEALFDEVGLMPELPDTPWRMTVPIYADGHQIGRATSGGWSTLLKKYIALASVEMRYAEPGTEVGMEITVDYLRKQVPAGVCELPFYRPARLRA
jgi:aminomethyltransferase